MKQIVDQALSHWGMDGAEYRLAADRENSVYRVTANGSQFALRLHRQGYRTHAELNSELMWMAELARGNISVPTPIAASDGKLLHVIEGVQVDVLTWLSGETLDAALPTFSAIKRVSVFKELGRQMAQLHDLSDSWTPPATFTRCAWNRAGLVGPEPLWDCFWDNPELTPIDRALFLGVRESTHVTLRRLESTLDYGLIHADLVSANVMVEGDYLHLIDFDDGGFGFRLFDIATALLKHRGQPDYPTLRAALIGGYTDLRAIDLEQFDLFLLLRAATYVGWNIQRMSENGAVERNARFIQTTRELAQNYLANPEYQN